MKLRKADGTVSVSYNPCMNEKQEPQRVYSLAVLLFFIRMRQQAYMSKIEDLRINVASSLYFIVLRTYMS